MTEADIIHENGPYWVGRERKTYTVYFSGDNYSLSDSAYPKTADGLSIAIARCNYLAKHNSYMCKVLGV